MRTSVYQPNPRPHSLVRDAGYYRPTLHQGEFQIIFRYVFLGPRPHRGGLQGLPMISERADYDHTQRRAQRLSVGCALQSIGAGHHEVNHGQVGFHLRQPGLRLRNVAGLSHDRQAGLGEQWRSWARKAG